MVHLDRIVLEHEIMIFLFTIWLAGKGIKHFLLHINWVK